MADTVTASNYESIVMSILGTNVKHFREAKEWSQRVLAEKTEVSRVTIARIEIGATMPDWSVVCRIADALGVSTDALRKPRKILAKVC